MPYALLSFDVICHLPSCFILICCLNILGLFLITRLYDCWGEETLLMEYTAAHICSYICAHTPFLMISSVT